MRDKFVIIKSEQEKLTQHPLYKAINSVEDLQVFMSNHVYAVWDFMSLLKRIQGEIAGTQVPWRPSRYSKNAVRLINEIVLAEESDEFLNSNQSISSQYSDHFTMYIEAMKEIGLETRFIESQIQDLSFSFLPAAVQNFISFHLKLATNASLPEVTASFLYGREDLLPGVFTKALNQLKQKNIPCPQLLYYLERHIDLDGGEHSHMGEELLNEVCQNDVDWELAFQSALKSIKHRELLWDEVLNQIKTKTVIVIPTNVFVIQYLKLNLNVMYVLSFIIESLIFLQTLHGQDT